MSFRIGSKAPYRLVVRPETLAEADAKRGYEERPGYLHRMLHIGMGAKEQAANQVEAALADVPDAPPASRPLPDHFYRATLLVAGHRYALGNCNVTDGRRDEKGNLTSYFNINCYVEPEGDQ